MTIRAMITVSTSMTNGCSASAGPEIDALSKCHAKQAPHLSVRGLVFGSAKENPDQITQPIVTLSETTLLQVAR